jgi:hypothetical protein
MPKEFEMSMIGELSFFLGLQITQTSESIFISQTTYIKEILKKFGMEYCNVTGCKLSKKDESKEENQTLCRSIIGCIMYVTNSRPYIM